MTDHEYEVLLLLLNGIGRLIVILLGMQAAVALAFVAALLVR